MPITFSVIENKNYFVAAWFGEISDAEMYDSYKSFYEGGNWSPKLNELADLSHSDMSKITSEGLSSLTQFVESFFIQKGVISAKTAAYSPSDLSYGMARIYGVWSEKSPEEFRVFRDYHDAIFWLINRD